MGACTGFLLKEIFPYQQKKKDQECLMSVQPHKVRQPQHFCENKDHSTQFDVSLPPMLPAWPLRYLRFHTLGLCSAWPPRLDCQQTHFLIKPPEENIS